VLATAGGGITMDSTTVARSLRGSIGILAMDWLVAPSTMEQAEAAGMPSGLASYTLGRLGVLGDCPIDNVVGAAFFWEPDHLRTHIREGRSIMSPREGAAIYTSICQAWGADKLAGFDGVERLGELCDRVVSTASPHGAPLFVGWRDQTLPGPGPQRTFQLCQTLRELRFSRHTVAVQAAGMSPLEAILSGPTGEWNAKFFGWPEPYPNVESLAAERDAIEAATDRLHAADLDVLTDDERADLRSLAKAARECATR
jgi:hypothetical protein